MPVYQTLDFGSQQQQPIDPPSEPYIIRWDTRNGPYIPNTIATPSQEESDTSMTNTTMNQDEFRLPNTQLIADYFRANDYRPSFLSGSSYGQLNVSVLIGANALNVCADTLNEKLSWVQTPQGTNYWRNVSQNLRTMDRFLNHSFLHSLYPDQYGRNNDPSVEGARYE